MQRHLPTHVSVVIPVKNGRRHLHSQLTALASQDYPGSWDVVVSDNGRVERPHRTGDRQHDPGVECPTGLGPGTLGSGATLAYTLAEYRGKLIVAVTVDSDVIPDLPPYRLLLLESMQSHLRDAARDRHGVA